jgi:hypothetical protein
MDKVRAEDFDKKPVEEQIARINAALTLLGTAAGEAVEAATTKKPDSSFFKRMF